MHKDNFANVSLLFGSIFTALTTSTVLQILGAISYVVAIVNGYYSIREKRSAIKKSDKTDAE